MKNTLSLKETKNTLDNVSSSFCAAKWLNSSIWLGTGMTASCHLPPAHTIDQNELKDNPLAIHNTKQKEKARSQMLNGERPSECQYCWTIEDSDKTSDRMFKSQIYTQDEITSLPSESNPLPKTVEISFDRACNFACAYCNSEFSTTWAKDIRDNGPYMNLLTEGSSCYTTTSDQKYQYEVDENPFVNAFFKLFDLGWYNHLDEIRVTGGEPFMSPHIKRFLERLEGSKSRIAINTNLCFPEKTWNWFINSISKYDNLHLYISNESDGKQAEYTRDGLDIDLWWNRLEQLSNKRVTLHIMATISIFSLDTGFESFLKKMSDIDATVSYNILRFPKFLSVSVAPTKIRQHYGSILQNTKGKNEFEQEHIDRLVEYFKLELEPSEQKKFQGDFRNFIVQYDKRRNKSFKDTFNILAGFYNDL